MIANASALSAVAPAIQFRGRSLKAAKRHWEASHRTATPEETLERIRPHFRTIGITRLADVTGLDRIGIPTALAYRPNSPTLSNASGKGFTLEAALVSGAMEALEIFHAENVRGLIRHASYQSLEAAGPVIRRDRLTFTKDSLFDPRRPEYWIEAWDIVSQQAVPVPFLSVSMIPHPEERPSIRMPFPVSSNGLASGNHLLEAMCAGILEVVERDALACHVWARWGAGHTYPKVDLATVQHPLVLDLLERFREASVGVILYDVTVDIDVPVYVATLYDRLNRHTGMYGGYGAHLDPAVAMLRALTEAAQSRLIYIAGSRDDFFRHDYLKHRIGDGDDDVRFLEESPATVDAQCRHSEARDSFEADVSLLVEKLRSAGLDQVLVGDLTHPAIGVPVVRVVVPGLEPYPFHTHYSPGHRAVAFARARSEESR